MTPLSIAPLSPSSWTAIGAPLGNHLWQSTLFAGGVWLLTLLLRKNHAQSRYVLWLIASAKFLIPFSLLIGLGSHLPGSRTPAVTQPAVFLAMETVGEPFAPVNSTHVVTPPAPTALQLVVGLLPTLVLVVWSVGCLVVLLVWYLRWQRVNSARRAALPLQSGRELEALRRAEPTAQLPQQIDLLLSQSALEPGILGIFRPALLLPAGISEKLTDAQLDSVIAHELCHVRRRDNLAAALHMLVEAFFWFHPLVWWMGTRLVEERERACDEEVLRLGANPHIYAESILKVCKFYLEPPLFCAAGVTGSNLKKRIEAIMSNRIAPSLQWRKKLLLSTMGVAAVVGPIMFGLLHTPQGSAQAQSTPPIAPSSQTAQKQTQSPEKVQAANAPASPDGSLTCMFASVSYPEGTVIQDGNGPEQLCARVLDRGKVGESGHIQHAPEWIHTSQAIRERSRDIVHLHLPPAVWCTPKPSTQSNLCSCEEGGPYSENAEVDSTNGGKLNCKKGQWVPLPADHAKQSATHESGSR